MITTSAVMSSLGYRAPAVASRAGSSLGINSSTGNSIPSLLTQPLGVGGVCQNIDKGRREASVTGKSLGQPVKELRLRSAVAGRSQHVGVPRKTAG